MPSSSGPFAGHLRQAIAVNRDRRPRYATRTRGRSWPLSTLLITAERASLPVAHWMDWRAYPWNQRGVAIIEADFVDLTNLVHHQTPPGHAGSLTPRSAYRLHQRVRRFRRTVQRHALAHAFDAVEVEAGRVLDQVEATERAEDVHLAMTRHLIESIGLAASHATDYRSQTQGGTDGLARDFILAQSLALPLAVPIDRLAQSHHACGVGILANDLPQIPFRAKPATSG